MRRLAKSVTLPDEEEQFIYGPPSNQSNQSQFQPNNAVPQPQLYRMDEPIKAYPNENQEQLRFYRREEPNKLNQEQFNRDKSSSQPLLYRLDGHVEARASEDHDQLRLHNYVEPKQRAPMSHTNRQVLWSHDEIFSRNDLEQICQQRLIRTTRNQRVVG